MAAGVAVILDIVLGPVKIAPVAVPAPAGGVVIAGAWSSIYGAVAFSGPCTWVLHAPAVVVVRDGPGPPGRSAGAHTRGSGGHVEVPDP